MKAACQFFGKCSGCSLQQFPYVKQLSDKTRAVRASLAQFVPHGLNIETIILPTVASPKEFAYRTSSKLCLGEDDFGRPSIGLYARSSKKVIDIPGCPVHDPAINKLIAKIFSLTAPLPAPFYNHSKRGFQAGRLKFLTIRFCPESNNFGLIISHTGVARGDLLAWVTRLKLAHMCVYESLLIKDDAELVISRQVQHLAGPATFEFTLQGRSYQLDPMAFFQANYSLTSAFIEHITEDLQGNSLLDLYGGFGTYSFAAAHKFTKIHLIEANPHAIEAARDVASRAALPNFQASAISAEEILKKLQNSSERSEISHIIVNPPRSGLSAQVLESLSRGQFNQLKRLHYVSCNMETLKRDLAILTRKGGFQVLSVTPFDMFPQTDHIEMVVKMAWKNSTSRLPKVSKIVPKIRSSIQ